MTDRDWYMVNEVFTSLQGEGIATGTPSTFIRLQGCPVGCSWCDSGPLADQIWGRQTNGLTRNTWGKGGTKMSVTDILTLVNRQHVVITGGEPTIWNLDGLMRPLLEKGHSIQLETSGYRELEGEVIPQHITISPKERLGFRIPERLANLAAEIKWVVDATLEFDTIWAAWENMREVGCFFILMPEGCPPSKETCAKAMSYLDILSEREPESTSQWLFGDRLQYRLGIR